MDKKNWTTSNVFFSKNKITWTLNHTQTAIHPVGGWNEEKTNRDWQSTLQSNSQLSKMKNN